jgi:uncharacterized membrane protein YphA (DoxX/SURF4 family)
VSASRLELAALWVLKVGIAVLFLGAAWPKLQDPATFTQEVANYQLLPEVAPYVAATLPGVELVLAVALLFLIPGSRWLASAAALAAFLMAGFTVATSQVVARGIDIECGCFGAGSDPVTGATIARDVVYLAGCLALLALAWRWEGLPNKLSTETPGSGTMGL